MWAIWTLCLSIGVLYVSSLDTEELIVDSEVEDLEYNRKGKVLPIFQVVRFPNDVCTGTTRNGTCFTAEECSSKGGTNEGSCASGFGICCVIKLACGGVSTVNNSYIVQSAVTTLTSPCTYQICPASNAVCRIRYDFTTHTLASQISITATAAPVAATKQMAATSHAIGDCTTDQFSIQSPNHFGSPIICGTNTGQHMFMDSDGTSCQRANFNIGASTTVSRSWDIYVTQYTCGEEDIGGPPGCLQYFTGTTGLVKSFGYLTSNTETAVSASTTHLQNQNYNICVRREKGYCYICWSEYFTPAHGAFGLSLSSAAGQGDAATGSLCVADYLVIPQGTTSTIAAKSDAVAAANIDRFCGRKLTSEAAIASKSVCSRSFPFNIGFVSDGFEIIATAIADMADDDEANGLPGGILGFALGFAQGTC